VVLVATQALQVPSCTTTIISMVSGPCSTAQVARQQQAELALKLQAQLHCLHRMLLWPLLLLQLGGRRTCAQQSMRS
jgi:hypothetical protein